MNGTELQHIIDSPNSMGDVYLPSGEFEGPFAINRPCRVIGNNTTLWRGKGPILTVNSKGVVLKDLRIEITNDSLSPGDNIRRQRIPSLTMLR